MKEKIFVLMVLAVTMAAGVASAEYYNVGNDGNKNCKNYIIDSATSNNSLLDFSLTTELLNNVAELFPGINTSHILKLEESNILSLTWELSDNDKSYLARNGEIIAFNIPEIRASSNSVYIMLCDLGNSLGAGDDIKLRRIVDYPDSPSVVSVMVEDIEYVFLDENYNKITEVPINKHIYIAMRFTTGRTYKGIITTSEKLPAAVIVPYAPPKEEQKIIANTLSIDADYIKFLSEENILPYTPEPADSTKRYAKDDSYEIIGKFNTISVDRDGLYILKINIEDNKLWKQLQEKNVENFKVYLQSNSELVNNSFLAIDGDYKLTTFESKNFLLVGILSSSQPTTLFIAKLISASSGGGSGGCNVGFGFLFETAIGGIIILKFLRRR